MRPLVYYVATTIDGFIAREDGSFDDFPWDDAYGADLLAMFPETFPAPFHEVPLTREENRRFDAVLMGRRTYAVGLTEGLTNPYPTLDQYVFFQALDQSSFARDPMLALLLLWGALEAIFSPAKTELRFRVSGNIATFLEPPGPSRAELQRRTARLYDARSAAAHGHRSEAEEPLIATYALLKRVLLRIVEEREVPRPADIQAALFQGI